MNWEEYWWVLVLMLLPIWRSGDVSGLTFPEFVLQHSIFGPGQRPGEKK